MARNVKPRAVECRENRSWSSVTELTSQAARPIPRTRIATVA